VEGSELPWWGPSIWRGVVLATLCSAEGGDLQRRGSREGLMLSRSVSRGLVNLLPGITLVLLFLVLATQLSLFAGMVILE
jgi:hypothetical protein